MTYITTTELRTKTADVVMALLAGESIDLIHRSKVLGEISPVKYAPRPFNAKRVKEIVEAMNFPLLSTKEIEQKYRAYIMNRYGKHLSRHK